MDDGRGSRAGSSTSCENIFKKRLKKPRTKQPKASMDALVVPYPQIRDRFLARLPEEGDDPAQLEFYVSVGHFVVDRWLAEELDRTEGEPLDEDASWDRWDQCSEKQLRDLRTEATQLVDREVRRRRVVAFLVDWLRKTEHLRGIAFAIRWTGEQMLKGFVSAIGLLIFGLLFLWAAPNVVKSVRGALDKTLPEETSPH